MLLGWRARLGQIRPATGIEGAEEWRRVAPVGVAYADTRTIVPRVDTEGLEFMMGQVLEASRQLATAKVDLIVQCGAPGIFLRGEQGYEAEITAAIKDACGVPAITMMGAQLSALQALGVTKVAIGTTYTDEVNAALARYLEAHHIKVRAIRGLQLTDPYDSSLYGDDSSYRLGQETFKAAGDANGILISCGTYRTFQMLPFLEQDTGVPVVSSNQASLWRALRALGLRDVIPNLGRLWHVA